MIKLKNIITELIIPSNMRIHMSKKPIITLRNMSYPQEVGVKPYGLWYGFGDQWINWVRDNVPEWEGKYLYRIIFPQSKKIAKLNSQDTILEFNEKYMSDYFIKMFGKHNANKFGPVVGSTMMDWPKVARDYDGIEIYPYIGRMRHELIWYYGWEVSSGCIWNLSDVTIKKLLK